MERLPEMGHYVLGLLRRGPKPPSMSQKAENRLQDAHLAHLRRLQEQGDLIIYGPLEGDTDLRGVLIFRTESIDRARELMRNDPWVIRGALVLDLSSWFAAAGLQVVSNAQSPTGRDHPTEP